MKGLFGGLLVVLGLAMSNVIARLGASRCAFAIAHFMLKRIPNRAPFIWFHLASLHERNGNLSEALRCLERGQIFGVESTIFDMEMARLFERAADLAAAKLCYERVLKRPRDQRGISVLCARTHAQVERLKQRL